MSCVNAFLISLSVVLIRGINTTHFSDAFFYLNQAQEIEVNGITALWSNYELVSHGAGFATLISWVSQLTGISLVVSGKLLVITCHSLSALLVHRIASRLSSSNKIGLKTTILFSANPLILYFVSDILTEAPTSLIILSWIYLYLKLSFDGNTKSLIWIALFSGIGVWIRPNFLLPGLLIIILSIICVVKVEQKITILISVSAFIYLSIVSLYEFMLFNRYDGFVLGGTNSGIGVAYMCDPKLLPLITGVGTRDTMEELNLYVNEYDPIGNTIRAENPGISTRVLSEEMSKIGLRNCASRPLQSLVLLFVKWLFLWRPWVNIGTYQTILVLISLSILLVSTFGIIKFYSRERSNPMMWPFLRVCLLIVISFSITLLITPPQIRHRIAILEPIALIMIMVNLNHSQNKILSMVKLRDK